MLVIMLVIMIYAVINSYHSVDLFSQQKSTAIWKVVTSRSYLPVLQKFIINFSKIQASLVCKGDCAIGHVVVPLQLPPAVLRLVELLHLQDNKFDCIKEWRDVGTDKCTSGMKSSSSLGKVTGTLSLVLAHAPTLRIFIETYRDR